MSKRDSKAVQRVRAPKVDQPIDVSLSASSTSHPRLRPRCVYRFSFPFSRFRVAQMYTLLTAAIT